MSMARIATTTILLLVTVLVVVIPSVSTNAQVPPRRFWNGAGGWADQLMTMFFEGMSLCIARRDACDNSCAGQAADLANDETLTPDQADSFYGACLSNCPTCGTPEFVEAFREAQSGG